MVRKGGQVSFIDDIASFFGCIVRDSEIVPASGASDPSLTAKSFAARRMAMYIAVSYVSNALSMCEIKTYEGGRAVKGDLYYALNIDPNPNQCGSAFINSLVEHYFYDGHALMVQPSRFRNDFYIADSFGIDEVPLGENVFSGISVEGQGIAAKFKATDCCYFRLESHEVKAIVHDMYGELGELLAYAMASYKNANGEKFTLTRGHPPGGKRSDEKESAAEVNERLHSFLTNPNGVLPLYTGQELERVKPVSTGSSNDVIALRKDIFETTASAFKIPQSMMYGNMTNTNDVVNQFITFGVDPHAVMISKELTRRFYGGDAWQGGSNRVEVDTSKLVHTDMFQVADKADKLLASGLFSIDEIRQPLGADPLGTDFSSAHWVTKNYTLIQDALAQLMAGNANEGGEQ